jgi:hypothetical protein
MYVIVARPTRKRRKGVLLSHGACHNSLGVEHSLSKRKVVGSNPACGFQATIFLSFLFGPLKREFPWCVLARMACGRLGIVTSLHTHYPRSVFGWCSWLSRQSNTLKVPSSILGSNIIPFLLGVCAFFAGELARKKHIYIAQRIEWQKILGTRIELVTSCV